MTPIEYFQTHKQTFLDQLVEFLKIKSISTNEEFKNEVLNAAKFVQTQLLTIGIENTKIIPTQGHPLVYGEWISDTSKPTVLIYGHYDVQPPDPYDLWESSPFEPIIKNEKIYARGASDDKGQVFMHIKAVESLIKTNQLHCNIKFLIEGEEEIGSAHLEKFVNENKALLQCDTILISDTSIISNDTPSITVGLRGLCYLEIEMTGPNRDLHSGVYGGAVANPINQLCKLLSTVVDDNGKVQIPHFYDDVVELSPNEREILNKAPFNVDDYQKDIGIQSIFGEKSYTTLERTGIRPTFDVNGIWGGYIEKGAKTVLPSKAFAKISTRLVPNQKTDKTAQLIIDYLQKNTPNNVKIKVTKLHGGEPALIPTTSKGYLAAEKAMTQSFGKKPIPTREGGSIPIVSLFQKKLNADPILLGFGLDSDAIHSPNEHFGLFNFYKGIETIIYFYDFFTQDTK